MVESIDPQKFTEVLALVAVCMAVFACGFAHHVLTRAKTAMDIIVTQTSREFAAEIVAILNRPFHFHKPCLKPVKKRKYKSGTKPRRRK